MQSSVAACRDVRLKLIRGAWCTKDDGVCSQTKRVILRRTNLMGIGLKYDKGYNFAIYFTVVILQNTRNSRRELGVRLGLDGRT